MQLSFLVMRKNLVGSFSFASVLVATALVGFDAQLAMACSGVVPVLRFPTVQASVLDR